MARFVLLGFALLLSTPASHSSADASPPNIVLIMADDMGFSDLGCYGSEIETPHLDALAEGGLRYTHFYNTSRCCPSRASLMTGKYQHHVEMGWMTAVDEHRPGYRGQLSADHPTIAELLKSAGYQTRMTGKWHLTVNTNFVNPQGPPNGSWPTQRGFDEFYGGLSGGGNYYRPTSLAHNLTLIPPETLPEDYYYTDAITEHAVDFIEGSDSSKPLFMYVAYYAPHRPLQAPADRVAKCMSRYEVGCDELRKRRFARQKELGIFDPSAELGQPGMKLPNTSPAWEELPERKQQQWIKDTATYAAMIEIMDDGVGEIVAALQEKGQFDNTLIIFLSDNGGTSEGPPNTNLRGDVSNTPYRNYKKYTHLGGVASPLIVHWPAGIEERGNFRRDDAHINDLLPTCIEVADVEYPGSFNGKPVSSPHGISLAGSFAGATLPARPLFWEHDSSRAVQHDSWRLVSLHKKEPWELYNLSADPFEQHDLVKLEPERAASLQAMWDEWAEANNVLPLETMPWNNRINYYREQTAQAK